MPDAVSVRQVSGLPRASFRFHLAMDTLASSYALGATSCARDFHPLERAHAEHTKKTPRWFFTIHGVLDRMISENSDYLASDSISIAPQGHSLAQIPQPLQ